MSRETGKSSQKIAKILRNKHRVFVPNKAIFYPGKKFDSGQNGLPGLLPVGQVRRQSYLPKRKIYLSRTTGRGLFLNTNRNQRTNQPSLQSCCSFGMEHFVSIARENNKMNDLHHIDDNFFFCINNDQPVRFSME